MKRFWDKVEKTRTCWIWKASLDGKGYGQFVLGAGRIIRAHRYSMTLLHGEFPSTVFVLHKCDNKKCVRPSHLFLGTQLDNMRDMSKKGRWRNQSQYITHCPRGHEYSRDNTGYNKTKTGRSRVCIRCRKQRWMNYYKTKKETGIGRSALDPA